MDDLRTALLIVGIVVVAAIYAFARLSRRKAPRMRQDEAPRPDKDPRRDEAPRRDEDPRRDKDPGLGPLESRDEDASVPDESVSFDTGSVWDESGTGVDIGRFGGVFAPRRDSSNAELSVDVSILAGLRATYESTLDGTVDESIALAPPEPSVDAGARTDARTDADARTRTDARAGPDTRAHTDADAHTRTDAGADSAEPVAIDMSRPLIYLTLVAKQGRVPGQEVLDALDAEGFRPGLMQLYYWCADAEPSVRFGVANMVEPGVLAPDELPGMETPGLVTFMSVPGDAASAFRIFDTMVAASRRLARRIDATVCDETRSTLTAQAENHLRETIADILRRDRT